MTVHSPTTFIIAVDGPAASGKGTLSRRLATQYGLRHLDTGLSYRAVAHALLEAGHPLDDEAHAVEAAAHVDFAGFDQATLSAHGVGEAASRVSVYPAVRRILVEKQRLFAAQAPGAVLDGRDIGTVIAPQAEVKIFVTASPEVRAERRLKELIGRGEAADAATVLADIRKRDARDAERTVAPFRPADDAHLLDTTHLAIEPAVRAALDIVEAFRAGRGRG